jgi:hypothetical protein
MTKFLQYKDSTDWWEWPQDGRMTVYNMAGGHHDINENDPRFMEGKVVEAEDWADLCRKMKYNPWKVEEPTREMWISPDGTMHDCGEWGAHEITADRILENLIGEEVYIFDCGDRLIELGWVKVAANRIMYQHYCSVGIYDNMTDEQWEAVEKWKERWL